MNRLFLTLSLVAHVLISLRSHAQVRLGVTAGVNVSNIRFDLLDSDLIPGYQAGLMADLGLTSHFSIRPALLVNSKGFSWQLDLRDPDGQKQETIKETSRPIYVEIPVSLVYKGNLGKSWRWYGGVGPYTGIGFSGKIKRDSDLLEDQKIKYTSEKQSTTMVNVYKRMDYGLNAALGVDRNRVQFGINYSYGLTGILPQENITAKIYNRTLALAAGYWFGK